MRLTRLALLMLLGFIAAGSVTREAWAEVSEVKIARQYGVGYLPLMVMEHDKLLEKHAKAAGLGNVTVTWAAFAGANVMNDALLSGTLDFAAVGMSSVPIIWAKTKETPQEVKAVCAIVSAPFYLNTRNPNVKSIRDFSDKDRIALPAVKVSNQAIVLQMAAEQAFGPANFAKLDSLTISRSHPDAMAALLSGASEINSHFTWPPFHYRELEDPAIHTVLNSNEVMGGPATTVVMIGTKRFRESNPRLYGAFLAAVEDAIATINRDKRYTAEVYLRVTKSKDPVESILKMLNDPNTQFTTTPQNVMKIADFMFRVGIIKQKPVSWTDLFFPEVHKMPGS